MEQPLFYNLIPMTYAVNAKVEVDKHCNAFTVVNTGTTNMIVNGVPLAPPVAPALLGEAVQFGGNRGEIFIGRIDISFTTGAGRCIVTQKIYVPNAGVPVHL
jgi:hypothetical protein